MALAKYTPHQINKSTWAIEEKTPINQGLCYLLLGSEQALLIDTCFGFAGLADLVRSLAGDLPVTVANTHAHVDHIGGNHLFGEIWFHVNDTEIFELHTNPEYTMQMLTGELPKPLTVALRPLFRRLLRIDKSGDYHHFEDGHVFHLGGRDIEVVPVPGHTPGSVCFLDRDARLLFTGDSVCEWGILLHFPDEGLPPAVFADSMRRLKGIEDAYDTIWPGHHGFPVDKSYVDDYLTCAEQLVAGTAEMTENRGRACGKFNRVLISVPDGYSPEP